MSRALRSQAGPGGEDQAALESLVQRFEEAWQHGGRPALDDYLLADNFPALVELVHVDLERRLKAGEACRVETYLAQYPRLAEEADVLLDLVAAEYRLRRRHEPDLGPAEYLRRFPGHRAGLAERLAEPPVPGTDPPAGPARRPADESTAVSGAGGPVLGPPAPAAAPGRSRYRPLRFHARGALGEVFVAEDEEFHREVALKRIQKRYADDADSRRRFLLEAEVTGRLEHPGIVPAYGLTADERGQPCYAMRLVQGETLQEAIRRFHEADRPGRDEGARGLELRQLLNRFVAVCNAVAYAHSRGIVHRDLKPANVMLGRYGETLVVDWGLARAIARDEAARASGEQTLAPSGDSGAGATQLGQAVGTPAFMPPEQAEGRWDRVGPASDIYSLGATLYCLLTGAPPFLGGSAEVLERVKRGDFPPPHERKKGVPGALAAVCLKAMARAPEQRYATVLDLAADVEHWLGDEPVSAWREPRRARLGRWARRHRVLVSGGAALLLAVAASLAVVTTLTGAAYEREHLAKKEAEENFDLARQAVEKYLTEVSENDLLNKPGLEPLRKKLLQAALEYHRKFIEKRRDDPRVRAELGHAYHRLAGITAALGSQKEAIALYGRALAVRQELAAAGPADRARRDDLAKSYHGLGNACRAVNRTAEALAAYREALALREGLARDQPDVPAYRNDLAASHTSLGHLHSDTARYAEATAAYRRALALRERLAAAHPTEAAYRQNLATTHTHLAIVFAALSQMGRAEAEHGKALAIRQALSRHHPDVPDYQSDLARSHTLLGDVYWYTGRLTEAEAAYNRALPLRERLAHDHPAVPDYQGDLARTYSDLSDVYKEAGRFVPSRDARLRALAIREKLARDHLDVPDYQDAVAGTYHSLGWFYHNFGQLARSRAAYEKAIALREPLVRVHPHLPTYQASLAWDYNNLGLVFQDAGQPARSEATQRTALALKQKLAAAHPDVPDYRYSLAVSYLNLGWLFLNIDQPEKALAELQTMVAIDEPLVVKYPDVDLYRDVLAAAYINLTKVYQDLGRPDRGVASYKQALAHCTRLTQAQPGVAGYQGRLGLAHHYAGLLYQAAGQPAKALAAFEEARAVREKLARDHPLYLPYEFHLAETPLVLGRLYQKTGEAARAETAYRRAVAVHAAVVRDHPDLPAYQDGLSRAHRGLGDLYRDTGRGEKAEAAYRRAAAVGEKLIAAFADMPRYRDELARAYGRLGNFYQGAGRESPARTAHARALVVRESLVNDFPDAAGYRAALALLVVRAGNHARGAAEADAVAQGRAPSGATLLVLARTLSRAAAAAGRDIRLSAEERERLAEDRAARAVALLRRAHAAGYFRLWARIEQVQKGRDLDPLRTRTDFKKLLAELAD